jgi:uncharacterized membrane protein
MLPSCGSRPVWFQQVRLPIPLFLLSFHSEFLCSIFLHYTEPSYSHPIHPATVHFPLAFLTLANILNLLYGGVLYMPNNPIFSRDRENLGTISILGYASNLLGIIASIPALLTGGAELYAMIQSNGLYQTDDKGNKTLIPKVKAALMHVSILHALLLGE